MMPKINPRDMQRMMQRMGINQQEIDAVEVIIKMKDNEIVISQPNVQKVNAMGQISYQISGKETIREQAKYEVKLEDIEVVVEQANCSKEEAINAIKKANGDLAAAIIALQK
jgi:nascent polypeptide-associated complex subunit alpha